MPSVDRYLRLMERLLIRDIFPDKGYKDYDLNTLIPYDPKERYEGKDWPEQAETMVGMMRLHSLTSCCTQALVDGVEGDFAETGIWRGGCGIMMRAVLEAYENPDKIVWLFDSFEGLPKPDPITYPDDLGGEGWGPASYLGVSLEEVRRNFERYELLDSRIKFIKGWFRDTIPTAEVEKLAVLRLDGDLYESTWVVMENMYPKLSSGGFVIIDDYALPPCRKAIIDYRKKYNITVPMQEIDYSGRFWRKD